MRDRISRAASIIRRSTQGSVAVIVAAGLITLLGCVALGSDVAFAMFKQRQMISAASSAAMAGAVSLATGQPACTPGPPACNTVTIEAKAVATSSGFTSGVSGVTIAINNPPLTGPNTTNNNAVEVIITQPQTLPLFSLFISGPLIVSGRAVATAGNNSGDCILAVDTGNANSVSAILDSNGANVSLNQCGIASNATGSNAIQVSGGAVLNAASVTTAGLVNVNNGGSINATNGIKTQQAPVADPYLGTAVPTPATCIPSGVTTVSNVTKTLSPGTYCGLSIGNNATVTLSPGTYIINGGGGLNVGGIGGGGSVTGSGVTIVLTGSGSNYATVSIGNGIPVTLSAPVSGATAGIVMYGDPAGPTTGVSSIQGGSVVQLTGALYFPTQTFDYGNGSSSATTCTQLIAWHIVFEGGATFNSNCAGTGVGSIGGSPSKLVE